MKREGFLDAEFEGGKRKEKPISEGGL